MLGCGTSRRSDMASHQSPRMPLPTLRPCRCTVPELNTDFDVYRVGTLLEMVREMATALAQDGKRVKVCVQQSLGEGIFAVGLDGRGEPCAVAGHRVGGVRMSCPMGVWQMG